jgi:hypothetical protein
MKVKGRGELERRKRRWEKEKKETRRMPPYL